MRPAVGGPTLAGVTMFVNTRAVKWILLAILAAAGLCALDIHCSNAKDAETGAGTFARVKDELDAGRRELGNLRKEQLAEELRRLRVLAKRLVANGETKRARAVLSAIQELEAHMRSR